MRTLAPLGRLIGLAMILAGLGTAALATPQEGAAQAAGVTQAAGATPAPRAGSGQPTAIGLAGSGTSYVGFSAGGRLQKVTVKGKAKGTVPLDQDEAVDGLYVTPSGDIWVDYESSVSLLKPSGHVRTHFDHDPQRSCDSSKPATRYGGITAYDNRVYVANRCANNLSVYTRTGDLLATVGLPGRPRGVAYGVAQAGRPAFVYVAIPDRGQVLAFKASSLRSSSSPSSRYTLKRPGGGHRPEPGGIVVDKHGQLTVTDMANNALYLVNTNYRYSLYRTLGHPPRASRAQGRLHAPGALAQHAQDGGGLSGNYFVLDTNNDRVQRWSTGGYTYWTRKVHSGNGGGDDDGGNNGGGGGGAPENVTAPTISGTAAIGSTLTCNQGTWSGSGPTNPISFAYRWNRDGAAISGATSTTYTVTSADDGARLTCTVRATNNKGSTEATSASVTVGGGGGGGDGPTNLTAPAISGTAAVGSTLTCSQGSWSGGGPADPISYAYRWLREGVAITGATSSTYTVVAADDGTNLRCVVRATNSTGTAEATSASVAVGGGGGGGGPTNTALPTITGTPAVGQTLTCNPGTWTGTGISFTYEWRRADAAIAGATATTYVVVAADAGKALTCAVTATNTGGSNTVSSTPVTVGSGGSGPGNTTPPTITGTASPGEVLTCNPGTWNGSGISFTYLWRRNGAAVGTGTTYTLLSDDVGASFTCTVTAATSAGSTTITTDPVTVSGPSGHVPANTDPPVISGTPAVGQTLTCSKGTWTGAPTTYEYFWRRDGSTIAGATAASYVVVAADAGASLRCTVVASNGSGNGAATSAAVVVSDGAPPSNSSLPSLTGTGVVGTALTCDKGVWNGVGLTFDYSWSRNGTPVPDTSASTYVVLSDDQATTLTCSVTARNGAGVAMATSTGRTVPAVAAGSPTVSTRPKVTGTAGAGQVLSCDPGTWTGSPTSYATIWQRDGATVGSGVTYVQAAGDQDHALRCLVVAGNAAGKGAARSDPFGGAGCTGPIGVVINGGAAETTTPQVQLRISAPAGATVVSVSNDATMADATPYLLSAGCTIPWTMDSIPGLPLTWSVYVQFDTGPTRYSDDILIRQPAARGLLRLW
ncbi:MAG: hypothetical protein H6529_01960 [Nocardioides sp.]|nr:hypothetical protein [Nocardioides sp.]